MIILLTEIEIQTLADEADENADQQIQCPGEYHPDWHSVRDSLFARAIQLAMIEKMRKELPPTYIFPNQMNEQRLVCLPTPQELENES